MKLNQLRGEYGIEKRQINADEEKYSRHNRK